MAENGTVDAVPGLDPQSGFTGYRVGTRVELTAHPDEGYKFFKWAGGLTGSDNPASLIVNNDTDVAAVFLPDYINRSDKASRSKGANPYQRTQFYPQA